MTSEASKLPLVVVTGASGFIATHIVQQLLETGKYRVRGTCRNVENATLLGLPGAKERLELVKLDLNGPEKDFENAVRGAKYVLHTASPFPKEAPKDEMEIITPAVEGTKKMLAACLQAGEGIDRVVVTSSTIAIQGGGNEAPSPEKALDETTWTNLEKEEGAYAKSKTMAERAAWQFMEEKVGGAFTLAVCNPCIVVGPSIGKPRGTSAELVRRIVKNEMPGVPHFWINHVDVRDVAKAHILAMTKAEAAGQRFLLAYPKGDWLLSIAHILRNYMEPKHRVGTWPLPYALMWLASWFDATIALVISGWGKQTFLNSKKSQEVLGLEYTPCRDTWVHAADSFVEHGVLKIEGFDTEWKVPKHD